MTSISQLLNAYQSLIPVVHSFRLMNADRLNRPLQPGKWSASGVIGHIMLWDRHFRMGAFQPITNEEPLTLQHIDYDQFNADAALYATTLSQEQLIDACIAERQQLIDLIGSLSERQLEAVYADGDGNSFTVMGFLEDFVAHDLHHLEQIERLA